MNEFSDIEIVGAKLKLSNEKCIFVFCTYIPPSRSNNRHAYDKIVMAIKSSGISDNDIVILLGDFNLPNIKYKYNEENKMVPYNFKPSFTTEFFDDINSMGIRQVNNIENHKNNVLDLIFLNDELECDLNVCTNPLVKIDKPHPPIECSIYNVIPKKVILNRHDRAKIVFDFKKTDFAANYRNMFHFNEFRCK